MKKRNFKSLLKGQTIVLTIVILIGTFMCINIKAQSLSFYVSTDGNDSNPGTINQPWKTIQKACNTLKPGETAFIRGGTYFEKVVVNVNGSLGLPITIKNFENERVIVDGTNANEGVINFYNRSYIRIMGLEICNNSGNDTPMGISIDGQGKGIEILNNKIYNITSGDNAHGIGVYGSNGTNPIDGLIIDGNEVFNCKLGQSESVVVNGNVTNFRITNNRIHHNDNIGIDCIGFEGTASSNDQARNGLIRGNIVYNISSKNNPTYSDMCADGIYVDGGKDIIIENNKIFACDIGIEVASEHMGKVTTNITVRNNIVYNSNLYGIAFGGSSTNNGYAQNCNFLNNTLFNNDTGICIQKSNTNIIMNNIIYGGNTLLEGTIGTNKFLNNIWYSQGGNSIGLSTFADPKFVNAVAYDFHLQSSSPAIDAGDPSFVPAANELDFDGRVRVEGIKVDCGAYEYTNQIVPTMAPTTISPTTVPTTTVPSTTLPTTTLPTTTVLPITLSPITQLPIVTSVPIPETDDSNKSENSTLLYVGKSRTSAIDYREDCDWFKFTTMQAGYYKIETTGRVVDTWGSLYNSGKRLIKSNDDAGEGNNFKILSYLSANTTYYIYVDGSPTGQYAIRVLKY